MPVYSIQLRHDLESDLPGSPPLEDYEPAITTDSKELWFGLNGSAFTPNFHDDDLTTATSNGRPATTRWVQNLISTTTNNPPSGIAWRTQANVFQEANEFQVIPTVTAAPPSITDDSNKVATTSWVQDVLSDIGNVAYKHLNNVFTSTNTFDGPTIFNAPTEANSSVDYRGATWVKAPTNAQTLSPSDNVATTQYVWDSHVQDSQVKKGATPTTTYTNADGSTELATLDWIHDNVGSANLLTSDNNWTGDNDYSIPPTISGTIPPNDNSSKVPNTRWVREAINSIVTGGAPVITKSLNLPAERNKILWSDGIVNINGSNYSVNAGSDTFGASDAAGTYYVVAYLSSGTVLVDAKRSSASVGANEILLGSFTVSDVTGTPTKEIASIINTPPDYARRDIDNTFTGANTFNNAVTFNGQTKGAYTIPNDSNDTTLATTSWVNSQLGNAGSSYLTPSANDSTILNLASGYSCIDLSGSCLKAPTPSDPSDVATKQWVENQISGAPSIPLLVVVSTSPSIQVRWDAGEVQKPDDTLCQVSAGGPQAIPFNTKYAYVQYSDCNVYFSATEPSEAEGKIIANISIDTSTQPVQVTINPIQTSGWASIDSPVFTGNPQTPKPASDVCDESIPNTEWVCDKLQDFLHGPCGDSLQYPIVYNVGAPSLLINVTNGQVPADPNDSEATPCDVSTMASPVALVAEATEYVWVRYSDCNVVASLGDPGDEGFILATVVTGTDHIISITQHSDATTETAISANYGVGFGGYLIYLGPVEC
mgnify:CR=1 FL=1